MLRVAGGGASLVVALTLAGSGPPGDEPSSNFTLAARAFRDFPLYFAGDRVDDLQLVAVLPRDDTASFVSFLYGDCTARDDSGCSPPAEIQVWPACRRNPTLYRGFQSAALDLQQTTIRGVPALALEDGTRLELQTGRSTVVVFADSPARARRVAGALRSLTGSEPPDTPLPPPAPGALDGSLPC